MSAAEDLTAPRPWRARPEFMRRKESPWVVVDARGWLVASFLSERDAKSIAAAPELPPERVEAK